MIPLRDNINSKTKPFINWLIILANCYVFYLELHFQDPHQLEIFIQHGAVIPAHLLAPDQKDMSPQVQALIQSLGQQIQQLGQERQKLMMALTEKNTDRAQRQDEIDKAFQAKMAALAERYEEAGSSGVRCVTSFGPLRP